MTDWTVVGLIVGAAVAVIGALVIVLLGRPDEHPADRVGRDAPPAAAPMLSRAVVSRGVVNRGIIALFVAGLAGVVSSVLTFLWPTLTGNTGGTYDVGAADDLRRRLEAGRRPYYEPSGGFYVVPYPAADLPAARVTYSGAVLAGMEAGWVALSQTCTHLGCRVPYCDTSGWFECPCHGSRFDGVGEQRRGPAPRGLDHYAVSVRRGRVVVDTRTLLHGPPTGTVTADSRPAGPHCG